MIVSSQANMWGCPACYNHQNMIDSVYCSYEKRDIEDLSLCPLEDGIIDSFV